jgi:hypothetical protein
MLDLVKILPVIVVILINYILASTGKLSTNSLTANTLRTSLFLIPNTLYIILHKYKLSYLAFVVAIIATFIAVKSIPAIQAGELSTFAFYVFNFIYFSLFIGVTYFSYFVIKGFKLKNIVFILLGIISHTIAFSGLLLVQKQPVNMETIKYIMHYGANTYLLVGLALAIGLLFFELPQPKTEEESGYYDDEDDDN